MVDANTLRRLNYLWKHRHNHDDDPDLQAQIIVVREIVETIIDTPSVAGVPTLFVAASDATAFEKSIAHYLCDGTSDEAEIIAAITELNAGSGGRVQLSSGTFTVGDTIAYPSGTVGVQLAGMGPGATILTKAASIAQNVITAPDASTSLVFRDFTVDGNKANNTIGRGILCTGDQVWVENVEIRNCDGDGYASSAASNNQHLVNCQFHSNDGDGLEVGSGFTHVTGCYAASNGGRGFFGGPGTSFVGCSSSGNTSHGFSANASNVRVIGCYSDNDGGHGIFSGPGPNIIMGNRIFSPALDGIRSNQSSFDIIVGNFIYRPDNHGIGLSTSHDALVANNVILEPGRALTNTYDGIFISASDRFHIWGNRVTGASASPQPRYGLNVSNSTSDNGIYVGNDVGASGNYGTGKYNDAGTGTVNTWPGAAAPQGDNF